MYDCCTDENIKLILGVYRRNNNISWIRGAREFVKDLVSLPDVQYDESEKHDIVAAMSRPVTREITRQETEKAIQFLKTIKDSKIRTIAEVPRGENKCEWPVMTCQGDMYVLTPRTQRPAPDVVQYVFDAMRFHGIGCGEIWMEWTNKKLHVEILESQVDDARRVIDTYVPDNETQIKPIDVIEFVPVDEIEKLVVEW